jgi:hypothetical protein
MDLILVFAAALTFYAATLAPAVIWGDSAALSLDVFQRSLQIGTAGDHPLYVLVGYAFAALPGDVARNVNFEAAVFGALAVMLVYRCARVLGASRLAAGSGAAALAVSHSFWQHAVIAEVYTANAFFLAAVLNLLLEWRRRGHWSWLMAAAVALAIGLTNHLVLATIVPAGIAFVVAVKGRALLNRWSLAAMGVLAAIAVILAASRPAPLGAALRRIWFGPPGIWEYLNLDFSPGPTAREAAFYVAYFLYQFPSVSLLLVAAGIFALLRDRRDIALLLLLAVAVNAATFIRHTVWSSLGGSKYVFYIPDYVVFAIFCAVGTDEVLRRVANGRGVRRRVLGIAILTAVAVVPPLLYGAMPSLVRSMGVDLVRARSLPYRDNNRFFLNPNKRGEDGAKRFGEEALRSAKPMGVIFADYTPYEVLLYLKEVDRLRPDVIVRSGTWGTDVPVRWILDSAGRRRPTYLATMTPGYYDLHGLTGEYDLVPMGSMIEVRPRDGAE